MVVPWSLARSRGTLFTVEGTLRELEKGSTDYSTWHVGPGATREEEAAFNVEVTDACRAYEMPAIAIVAIVYIPLE